MNLFWLSGILNGKKQAQYKQMVAKPGNVILKRGVP
jgi:hypothetical protein